MNAIDFIIIDELHDFRNVQISIFIVGAFKTNPLLTKFQMWRFSVVIGPDTNRNQS
jgi:hypothetical protein